MKRKAIVFVAAIAAVIIVWLGAALWMFGSSSTEIRNGFSSELVAYLDTRYHLTIPENAKFSKGIFSSSFRDSFVVILFECAIDDVTVAERNRGVDYIFQTLKLDESNYHKFGGVDREVKADWYDDFGGKFDYCVESKKDPYTFISYTFSNDTLTIRFVGYRPGNPIP